MDLCQLCDRQWTTSNITLIYRNLVVGEVPSHNTMIAPSFLWKPYRHLFNAGVWFPHETMTFTPQASTQDEYFTHRHHFPYLLALCSPQLVSLSAVVEIFLKCVTERDGVPRSAYCSGRKQSEIRISTNCVRRIYISEISWLPDAKTGISLTFGYAEYVKAKAQALQEPRRMTHL